MEECSKSTNKKPYKCSFTNCNEAFCRPWRLKRHERLHTGEKPFCCDIDGCLKKYTNACHLKRHKYVAHEKKNNEGIVCEIQGCGRAFVNKFNLQKHLNRCHNSELKPFKCTDCELSFKKKHQLQQHRCLHGSPAPFNCELCTIEFGSYHLYKKHLRSHKTFTCDCGEIFHRWTEFCLHRRTSCKSQEAHRCVICSKTFLTKSNLKEHALSHLEESQKDLFRCPYLNCTRSYLHKRNLSSHISSFHEKIKQPVEPFQCSEPNCKAVLKTKRSLKQHIRVVHNALKEKIRKPRQPRQDRSTRKKHIASKLSGIQIPYTEHKQLLKKFSEAKKNKSKVQQKNDSNNVILSQGKSQNIVGKEGQEAIFTEDTLPQKSDDNLKANSSTDKIILVKELNVALENNSQPDYFKVNNDVLILPLQIEC